MEFRKLLKIFLASVSLPFMFICSTFATEVKITRAALDSLKSICKVRDNAIIVRDSSNDVENNRLYPIYSDDFGSDPANMGALMCDCVCEDGNTCREPFSFDTLCQLLGIRKASFQAIVNVRGAGIEGLFYDENGTEKCILALNDDIDSSLLSEHRNCIEGIRWWVTSDIIDSMNFQVVSGTEAKEELLED